MSRPLEDVQDEILDRIHAGEAVDREAVLTENPEHEEALEAFFEVLDIVEGTGDSVEPALARLGEFRIIQEIGRGGMGRIYEAEQTSLNRRVALKVLPPTLRLDVRLVSRFRREAEAAGRLKHPGIVPVFSVGEAAGTPFFVMELVEGVSLHQVLEKRRAGEDAGLPTDPEAYRRWAVETAAKVADALAYAHLKGILHRDVKPGNVMLGEDGAPRLTDFGLALDRQAPELTQEGEVFGSPQYMSPEQAVRRDLPIDERTDVYSLAVTLYELLTLRLPYEGSSTAEFLTALLAGKIVPPRKVDPSMPRELEAVLMGALQKDPHGRYRGAAAFAHDLRASLEGEELAYKPRVSLVHKLRVPLMVAGIAAVVALAYVLWPRDEEAPRMESGVADAGLRSDEVAAVVDAEYTALGTNVTPADFKVAIERLQAADSEATRAVLQRIYGDYILGPGKDDGEARLFLGYREFAHEIPEAIAYRGYPFLRAVEAAGRKRWFGPEEDEAWDASQRAWTETQGHAQGLADDPQHRARAQVHANLGEDAVLGKYYVTSRWAGPHLLCYVGREAASDFGLLLLPDTPDRTARVAEMIQRRAEIRRLLTVTGRGLAALSGEYVRRFAEVANLKPLQSPWGGRPDLPLGARSFPDGVPLVVLLFDDLSLYVESEAGQARREMPLPPGVRGYFSPKTGFLYVVTRSDGTPQLDLEPSQILHDGVHQLQYWFRRQRRAWWTPPHPFSQNWFEDGLAEYLAAVEAGSDGGLAFVGVNSARLKGMQMIRRTIERQGKEYKLFPLQTLASIETYADVMREGSRELGLQPALAFASFFQQAWALTYFLNHAEDGRYRKQYENLFGLILQAGGEKGAQEIAFRGAFGIKDDVGWAELDQAFRTYVFDTLMKMPVPK